MNVVTRGILLMVGVMLLCSCTNPKGPTTFAPEAPTAWAYEAVAESARWKDFRSAMRSVYWREVDDDFFVSHCRSAIDAPIEARIGSPLDACIAASLSGLDSRSEYFPPAAAKAKSSAAASYIAIGLELAAKEIGSPPAVVATIENGPAERAGMRARDLIVEIDGADTRPLSQDEIIRRLRGSAGSTAIITVLRDGKPETRSFSIAREEVRIINVRARLMDSDVAYMRLRQFNYLTTQDFAKRLDALTPAKALIIDLRSSSGGVLESIVEIAAAFGPDRAAVVAFQKRGQRVTLTGQDGKRNFWLAKATQQWLRHVPLVVLVNEKTSSGAEAFAQFLREQRQARLIGVRTFGIASINTVTWLDGGAAVSLLTAEMQSPAGVIWSLNGLRPDIEIGGSAADPDWNEKDDPQLQQALLTLRAH